MKRLSRQNGVTPSRDKAAQTAAERAFTLIELLAVMVIMSLLIALAAPAVLNALGSTSLTTAGDLVRNKLTQAQQEAIAKNTPVEVRFYYYEDRDYQGDAARVRAFQMIRYTNDPDDPGTAEIDESKERLSEPIYLEGGIVMSAKTGLSSFPDFSAAPADTDEFCTRSVVSGEAKHWSFRFLPDGSTNLPGNSLWFVTLLDVKDEEKADTGPPSNYYTVQLDPLTGSARIFRPGE